VPLVSRFVRYAPKAATFLVFAHEDNLPRARRLLVIAPLASTDGGEGGNLTITVAGASASARGAIKLAGQLGGTADAPDVRGVRVLDATVPVLLAFGEVQDGEALVRSGAGVVGVPVVPQGGGTMSGNLAMDGNKVTGLANGSAPGDAAPYGQMVSMLNGLDWQQSVLDRDLAAPPGSPATKDRYLVAGSASGAWSGHTADIAEWNGSAWAFTGPNKGMTIHVEDEGVDLNYNGTAWVNIGASVDHNSLLNLSAGNPHTQYQLGSAKDQNNGYAGLDGAGFVTKPTKVVRAVNDPGSPAVGEVWIKGADLKFQDNQGAPATQVVERVARRNQANGYAGLDGGGRVAAAQAPIKATYAAGGDQGLVPADIGAPPAGRSVATGAGLSGGGDLTADRTIAIAAFSGVLSKDFDPGSLSWTASEVKVHQTYDVGADGQLVPVAVRLPATVNTSLRTEVVFEFDDTSNRIVTNAADAAVLDLDAQGIALAIMGDLGSAASANGRRLRKIKIQTRNNDNLNPVNNVDVGIFRVRAWATPRGGGMAL
jgi:hypothetical protein